MISSREVALGPARLIRGYAPDVATEQIVFRVPLLRPRSLFAFTVPAFGPITGAELRLAVGRQLKWRILDLIFQDAFLRKLAVFSLRVRAAISRRLGLSWSQPSPAIVRSPTGAAGIADSIREEVDRLDLPCAGKQKARALGLGSGSSYEKWDSFFETEDPFSYETPYEKRKYEHTLFMLPPGRIARALELGCAEGHFTALLAQRVDHLRALDISSIALERAAKRCKALDNVEYVCSDFFHEPIDGTWDLVLVSEVFYYMEGRAEFSAFAERLVESLSPGGYLIHVHPYMVTDDPAHTGYDWGFPFGAQTIVDTFRGIDRLRHVRGLSTEIYRVDLFQRPAEDDAGIGDPEEVEIPLSEPYEERIARQIVWNGAIRTRQELQVSEKVTTLPVLMYHRIADDGLEALSRYRVSLADFEHQLRFLRRRGFHSITPAEWDEWAAGGSMRGRPIMLSFDDAFLDFYDSAWPILKRNGFGGHVFVPTAKVGGTADWDAEYGEPAPLMNWDQIAELAREGCTFGSHMASHSRCDRLSTAALWKEAVFSRLMLEKVTNSEITTIAPPYGATDGRAELICADAGYRRMFGVSPGLATVHNYRLRTPRIEIAGDEDIGVFAEKCGMAAEPPEAADLP